MCTFQDCQHGKGADRQESALGPLKLGSSPPASDGRFRGSAGCLGHPAGTGSCGLGDYRPQASALLALAYSQAEKCTFSPAGTMNGSSPKLT
jgi:hypothetical protein